LRLIRRIAILLPKYGKLMYCLYRDPRVPRSHKLKLLAGLVAIYGPWDLPIFIPVVGEMDALALTALAVKLFVDHAPEDIVAEHQELIRGGESVFDRDFRSVRQVALETAGEWLRGGRGQLEELAQRWRHRQARGGRW